MRQMNTCKKIKDNIFFFNSLSEQEKNKISEHIAHCPGCQDHFNKIHNLTRLVRSKHIEDSLIESYVIYQNQPDEAEYHGKKLNISEINLIEKHLLNCSECSAKFEKIKSTYLEMDQYMESLNFPDIILHPQGIKKILLIKNMKFQEHAIILKDFILSVFLKHKSLAISVSVFAFIIISVLCFSENSGSIKNLALIEDINIPVSTRSAITDDLQKGILLFNQKKYSMAVTVLERYIKNDLKDYNKDYARYILGLSYLKQAGVLKDAHLGSDHLSVLNKGIKQLNFVLKDAKNPALSEDIVWFLGKAYLMKKDTITAKQYFEKVIALKGNKSKESQEILDNLQDIK